MVRAFPGTFVVYHCVVFELMAADSLAFGLSHSQSFCGTETSVERPSPANLVKTAGGLGSHFPCDNSWCLRELPCFGTSCSVMKHGTSTAPYPLRAAREEGPHSGGIPSLSLAGESSRELCEGGPGRSLGPSRSFPTRWHQRCCSDTSRATGLAQCGCARFGFPQNLWLWGWGIGFPVGCNMESFFCLDSFTAVVIGM